MAPQLEALALAETAGGDRSQRSTVGMRCMPARRNETATALGPHPYRTRIRITLPTNYLTPLPRTGKSGSDTHRSWLARRGGERFRILMPDVSSRQGLTSLIRRARPNMLATPRAGCPEVHVQAAKLTALVVLQMAVSPRHGHLSPAIDQAGPWTPKATWYFPVQLEGAILWPA